MKTAFGSQAKKPDCKRERSEQSERAQEKGAPFFLLLFTSISVSWEILLSPAPSPLWQESCQKGNKPSALEKTSRTGRKKQALGKAALPTKSTQTKNEWEFLFPTLLISVFVESSTTTGPFPLRGGVIYENKQPQMVLEWGSGFTLPVEQPLYTWHCSCTLGNSLGLTGRDFPPLSSTRTQLQSSSAHNRTGQQRPHFNVSLEISQLCKCSKAASHVPCELNYHLRTALPTWYL